MTLVTLAVFIIILILAFYLLKYVPDATLQLILRIIIVVGAVLWILTNLNGILHLRVQ
jgi:hypothetical protein